MTLAERLVALHRALSRRRVPHAFGGAIALAYWTLEPRGTRDIDVNVFVPAAEAERVLRALPEGVARPEGTAATIERDGQVRLWWDDTPVDLFFDYVPVHEEAARNRRTVPFEGTRIPVLGPTELAVFKAMFDRTRDWADVEAMAAAGTLDVEAVKTTLRTLVEADDPRFERLDAAASAGAVSGARSASP
ncbi:MAG TPA: nucleotidyl transferase AbiEii/AbiGii toxin family protein [Thermoleophilaceae bacterium]